MPTAGARSPIRWLRSCLRYSTATRSRPRSVETRGSQPAATAQRLARVTMHPPKRVIDIPEPFAKGYFALMPIHERLRGEDFSTLRSYLRVTLCNIHDEFTKRIDPPSVVQSLRATAP